jgi:diguanylate cyclase (GGDEF)-like protein
LSDVDAPFMKAAFPPRVAGPALAAASGLAMVALFAVPRGQAATIATVVHAATLVLAIGSLLAGPISSRELRTTRRLLAAAVFTSGAGMMVGIFFADAKGVVPVPSPADLVSLTWPPLAILGFWKAPRGRLGRTANARLLADAALCTSSLVFASWLTFLGPVFSHEGDSPLTTAVQSAYPLSEAFVAALVLALLPVVRAELRGFFDLIVAAMVLAAIGDSWTTLRVVQDGTSSFGWPDVPMQLGLALMVLAPWRRTAVRKPSRVRAVIDANLAQMSVVVAGGVAIWHVSLGHPIELVDCVLGVLMLTACVARQALHTTELQRLAESHRYAAEHDPLTDLASRHAFLTELSEQLACSGPVGIVMLDVDGFQEINDAFGQEVGDSVLRAVGARAQDLCAPSLVARMGSDELAVLLVGPVERARAAELSRLLADSQTVETEGCSLDLGCSVGWVTGSGDDKPEDLVARAELALHAAKADPTSVVQYHPALGATRHRRHLLIAGLAHAVRRRELSLVYQPVQCLADDRPVAVEALLRWRHPQLGDIPPTDFIPLAEDSGHIRCIGSWVLREAITQLSRWEAAGVALPQLYVNLSAKQLTDDLPDLVLALLADRGVAPHRLVLEITESHLPDVAASEALVRLRSAGVQVALDDFGSGYSSLAQLVRLPIDIVKLDRDLVTNLAEDGGEAVLTSAVALARSLGMRTVTEGIETAAQLAAVQRAGSDLGQGYLFSKPLPPDELFASLPRVPDLIHAPRSGQVVPG